MANLGDGVFQITLPLIALSITRDPGAFAVVALVGNLPWLLVALPAGALADRLDRRRTMVTVAFGRAVLIGGLAVIVASGRVELWMLYVVAFALGVGETLFDTAAQSILPAVVAEPADLARANGRLYAAELSANEFVGPPLGGVLAGATLAGALWVSAGAYAAAAGVLLLLVGRFRPVRAHAPRGIGREIVDGLRYLAGHRVLRSLALCVGLFNLASIAMMSVFPLYAVDPGPMGLGPTAYAVLLTSMAVGSLAGSLFTQRLEDRLGRRRALLLAAIVFPCFPLAPALSSTPAVIFVTFVLGGAFTMCWNVITVSLRQRIVPDHLLGRVNAGYRLVGWGTLPLGAVLGGLLGEHLGLRAVFWAAAAVSALCIPLILVAVTDRSPEAPAATDRSTTYAS